MPALYREASSEHVARGGTKPWLVFGLLKAAHGALGVALGQEHSSQVILDVAIGRVSLGSFLVFLRFEFSEL